MQATFILEPNEIDITLINKLKAIFGDKKLEINIQEVDDTTYLCSSSANKQRVANAMANIACGANLIEADAKLFE